MSYTSSYTGPQIDAAINQVNDNTGSGKSVRQNSPTLIAPNLGAANAVSINFGDTAFANYKESIWTPTASGLTTSGTVTLSGKYTRIGNVIVWMVTIEPIGGGTMASTAASTYITLPTNLAGGCIVTDYSSWLFVGGGLVTQNMAMLPTWSTTDHIMYVSGTNIILA